MSDSARDLLVRGLAAAKARDVDQARFYLEWVLRTDSSTSQRVDAWYWLSEVSDDPVEKRDLLENAIIHDPSHHRARRSLAILDGRLDPDDIINPDQHQVSAADTPSPADADRFVCPQCGGRMSYSPDGRSLVCEYCASHAQQGGDGSVDEQDFIAAMATAQGHSHPVTMNAYDCQACGTVFVLSPETISLSCPYCDAVYAIKQIETRELIPPEAIIPLTVTKKEAQLAMAAWLKEQDLLENVKASPVHGFYFPAWSFDLSGEIPWHAYQHDGEDWELVKDMHFTLTNDLLVPASNSLPSKLLADEIYNLEELKPYDPQYLADWPATTYDIKMSDAALEARVKCLDLASQQITSRIFQRVKDLTLVSSSLTIIAFKLILLPAWLTHYELADDDRRYDLVVNGQTGEIQGQKPKNSIGKVISKFLRG